MRDVPHRTLAEVAAALLVILAVAIPAHAQGCDPLEIAKLLADDGAPYDYLGRSVSIDGDTAVVGAYADDDNGGDSGSACVFTRTGGVWRQQARLLPDDGAQEDYFGDPVSLSGDTIVIGAHGDDDNGAFSGSAYVFTRSGGVWTQQAKLLPGDGWPHAYFGLSIAIEGNTVVVGAHGDDDNGPDSGSAYVFTRSAGVWTQEAKLLPDDGAEDDRFGYSVSFEGDTAVVGAVGDQDNGDRSGSVYVFTRSAGEWTQRAKLLPNDGAARDYFGFSVSLGGDTAVIGALGDDDNGSDSGSAYVFTGSGGAWDQQAKLLAGDGASTDEFGRSVSIDGDMAVIGAHEDRVRYDRAGSAYVFTRSGGVWAEQAKFVPGDGAEFAGFGFSVSVNGDTAVSGAWRDSQNGYWAGAAYIFDLGCIACPADFNGDRFLNTQDFIAFLNAWANSDPRADWNGDGEFNTQDFIVYLNDWAAGC